MPSPFPGMDPYIEACRLWGDFHRHLIEHICGRLADATSARYLVRTDDRSYLVRVEEEHREPYVDIYEATPEQRLVTCLEVLSPSNKCPGTPGWDLYLRKRQSLMLEGVNLVELDLLRGGRHMPMLDPWPGSPYALLVARAQNLQVCNVWPAHFRQPLPVFPIPLAKPDPDISLELQPMVDAIYQRSRYERSIDYTKPLDPPLGPEETEWLRQRLRGRT